MPLHSFFFIHNIPWAGVFFSLLCPSNNEQKYELNISALLCMILHLLTYYFTSASNKLLMSDLSFFFSSKMFVLTVCNPDNCCYSTISLAFSINHLYFKIYIHGYQTPFLSCSLHLGKVYFSQVLFFYRMPFLPQKNNFIEFGGSWFYDLQEYSDNQFIVCIKICHFCSNTANRCLRRKQLCCPMKARQNWKLLNILHFSISNL